MVKENINDKLRENTTSSLKSANFKDNSFSSRKEKLDSVVENYFSYIQRFNIMNPKAHTRISKKDSKSKMGLATLVFGASFIASYFINQYNGGHPGSYLFGDSISFNCFTPPNDLGSCDTKIYSSKFMEFLGFDSYLETGHHPVGSADAYLAIKYLGYALLGPISGTIGASISNSITSLVHKSTFKSRKNKLSSKLSSTFFSDLKKDINSSDFELAYTSYLSKDVGMNYLHSHLNPFKANIISLVEMDYDFSKFNSSDISKSDLIDLVSSFDDSYSSLIDSYSFTDALTSKRFIRSEVMSDLGNFDSSNLFSLFNNAPSTSIVTTWIQNNKTLSNKIITYLSEEFVTGSLPVDDLVGFFTSHKTSPYFSIDTLKDIYLSAPDLINYESVNKISPYLSSDQLNDLGVVVFNTAKKLKDISLVDLSVDLIYNSKSSYGKSFLKKKVAPFYLANGLVDKAHLAFNYLD